MVSFYQFARPAILTLLGASTVLLPGLKARLITPIRKKTDRPHYIRGLLTGGEELRVRPSGEQGSGILSSMAAANCFIVMPAEMALARAGELVDCEVFGPITPGDSGS
jgi:molybdopterin molybdotransferase